MGERRWRRGVWEASLSMFTSCATGLRVVVAVKAGFGGPRRFGGLDAQSRQTKALGVWFRVVEKTFGYQQYVFGAPGFASDGCRAPTSSMRFCE